MNQLSVFDLIQAVTLSIGNSKAFGKIYNIAGDDNVTLIEFINLCGKVCSFSPTTKNKEMILKYKDIDFASQKRHFDFFDAWPEFDTVCSNSLVKKELMHLRQTLSKINNLSFQYYLTRTYNLYHHRQHHLQKHLRQKYRLYN